VDHKGPIAALLVFILIGGIFSLVNLPISLFPEVTFPKIKVIIENGEQPVNK